MRRVHVIISGLVTGVFFRAFIREHAESLGIKGWVRNVSNKVEAVFEGDDKSVEKMIEYCKQGPINARVEHVKVKEKEFKGEFDDFNIIR